MTFAKSGSPPMAAAGAVEPPTMAAAPALRSTAAHITAYLGLAGDPPFSAVYKAAFSTDVEALVVLRVLVGTSAAPTPPGSLAGTSSRDHRRGRWGLTPKRTHCNCRGWSALAEDRKDGPASGSSSGGRVGAGRQGARGTC